MQTRTFYPSPALQAFISHYRIWKYPALNATITVKDFPRTMMDMIFFFDGNIQLSIDKKNFQHLNTCAFVGHFDRAYEICSRESLEVLNVRFRPNGVYPLTKIPMQKLLNSHIHLGELIEEDVKEWHEKLAEAKEDNQKIVVLERLLLDLYQKNELHHRLDYGIRQIQKHKGLMSVQNLANSLNTNYKSLDRWFSKKVGVSPKRFLQLTRFKYILDEIEQSKNMDWMQLVVDYRFHDQAHFTKEFKQFAGVTPSQFRAGLQNTSITSPLNTLYQID
ncbi:MAG: helix-turn-helix domain-containing protein [Bacteroidota bacterium]